MVSDALSGRWGRPALTLPRVRERLRRKRKPPHVHGPECEPPGVVALVVLAPKERADKLVADIYAIRQSGEPGAVSVNVADLVTVQTNAARPAGFPPPGEQGRIKEYDMAAVRRRTLRRSLIRRTVAGVLYGMAACAATILLSADALAGGFIGLSVMCGFVTFR